MSNTEKNKKELERKLLQFLTFPDGWDGMNGHAPAKKHIDAAVEMLEIFPDKLINEIHAFCFGDGDVAFLIDANNIKEGEVFVAMTLKHNDDFSTFGYVCGDVTPPSRGKPAIVNEKQEKFSMTTKLKDGMPSELTDFLERHWGERTNDSSSR